MLPGPFSNHDGCSRELTWTLTLKLEKGQPTYHVIDHLIKELFRDSGTNGYGGRVVRRRNDVARNFEMFVKILKAFRAVATSIAVARSCDDHVEGGCEQDEMQC